MYFRFLYSPKYDSGVIRNTEFEDKTVSFSQGCLIKSRIPVPIQFAVNSTMDDPPPDFTGILIPVLSNRLVKALQDIGVDNLQCFPAKLVNEKTNETWTEYQAVNIVGTIACADLSKSEYEELGGGLFGFDQLVVNPEKINGLIFFRLAEDPSEIIAHKKVGDYLYGPSNSKMTGFMFRPAFIP